jgi:hypothetical protein
VISLDLAKKLKEAGLKPVCTDLELFWLAGVGEVMYAGPGYEPEPEDVWLPRLDRLLAEIERRGYRWHLYPYKLPINSKSTYACELAYGDNTFFVYKGDTPEDAAGSALLAILEQGKEAEQDA